MHKKYKSEQNITIFIRYMFVWVCYLFVCVFICVYVYMYIILVP